MTSRTSGPVAERFAQNLLHARESADLSQEELAFRAALHRTEIGLLERGVRMSRIDTLAKLAGALGVEPAALLAGSLGIPASPREAIFSSLHLQGGLGGVGLPLSGGPEAAAHVRPRGGGQNVAGGCAKGSQRSELAHAVSDHGGAGGLALAGGGANRSGTRPIGSSLQAGHATGIRTRSQLARTPRIRRRSPRGFDAR